MKTAARRLEMIYRYRQELNRNPHDGDEPTRVPMHDVVAAAK